MNPHAPLPSALATYPIPQPRPAPIIGNVKELDPSAPVQSFMRLASTYGPIYRLDLPMSRAVFISSQALVHEACDEARFSKHIHPVIAQLRGVGGDGLFTARNDEPNWAKAHRVLTPAFGPVGVRAMFDPMLELVEQMLLRWERFGPAAPIDVSDQMTRLTLDTIALCAFNFRFNSFYQTEPHPFIAAMVRALEAASARTRRPEALNRLLLSSNRRLLADTHALHAVADALVAERRLDPSAAARGDLLSRMLAATDPVTGERLSDENIRYQMVTFLIAGHETTSGLLSFALHLLLQHPAVMAKARAVVDEVLGAQTPRLEHLPRLRYIEQVLMETLRLWPTAPAIGLRAHEDTTLGGRYAISRDDALMVLIPALHRDPTVWDAPEAFRPERFDPAAEAALPPDAWKPFGNGMRACIGRAFAMQEALLALSMTLQRFDLTPRDPRYALKVKEALTLKPDGLYLYARRRAPRPQGARAPSSAPGATSAAVATPSAPAPAAPPALRPRAAAPLLVLFGSNTGTGEAFAAQVAAAAAQHGFDASAAPMDAYAGRLPSGGALVVVTSSYEGQPPDNASQCVAALDAARPGDLSALRFAVFGCGDRRWARTYQAVPTRVDEALARAGAQRALPRGEGDASGDLFGAFDGWVEALWPALRAACGVEAPAPAPEVVGAAPALRVEVTPHARAATLRYPDLALATVLDNHELVDMSAPFARSKRHITLALPEGMTYRAGDYLAVLPQNPPASVARALRLLQLSPDALLTLQAQGDAARTLPVDHPITAAALLAGYVELAQPATRAQVQALAAATRCPPERRALEALCGDEAYTRDVLGARLSALDLLERSPSCALDLADLLQLLPPLRPRTYSISSSPLWDARRCTLTVAVVGGEARSGQGPFCGVASSFLASAQAGEQVSVAVRPSSPRFHPPEDPSTPAVMICAGSGVAPFRGFIQERALQKRAGLAVGPALLFFGCDHPDVDLLYRDALSAWQAEGVVDVRVAASEAPTDGERFVQDRVWRDRADVAGLVRAGATVYVCGDGLRMAPAVRDTLARAYAEEAHVPLSDAVHAIEHTARAQGRLVEDIFA